MTAGKLPPSSSSRSTSARTVGGDLTSVCSNFNYTVVARLKSGVTAAEALAQLNVIQATWRQTRRTTPRA